MGSAPVPLTSFSEEQRAVAFARFEIVGPALEDGISQAQIARTHQLVKSTVQHRVARYREQGLAGLTTTARKDKGKSRRQPMPDDAGRACACREPAASGQQRGRRDGSPESHHWT